jgi:hypothetical protein
MVGYNVVVEAVEERRKIACRVAAAGKWATAKMVPRHVGETVGEARWWTKRRKHRAHATGARVRARDLAFLFNKKRNGWFNFFFFKKNLTPETSSVTVSR